MARVACVVPGDSNTNFALFFSVNKVDVDSGDTMVSVGPRGIQRVMAIVSDDLKLSVFVMSRIRWAPNVV